MAAGDLTNEMQDGLTPGPRRAATIVIAVGTFMGVLDSTVANIALPTFVHVLHISPAESVWIVNAYALALVGSVLPLAVSGDHIGYGRLYRGGLLVFTAGSFACALAPTFGFLIAARILQGFGAAAIMSIAPALFRMIYPARVAWTGLGISALVVACSSAAGPTIGGVLLHYFAWPWLFAVNIPIGIVDYLLARHALPHVPMRNPNIDVLSVCLSITGLPTLIFGIDTFARERANPISFAALLIGCCAIAVLIVRQGRVTRPLISPGIFRIRRFTAAAITSCLSFTAQGLAFVSLPFFFHENLHADVLLTGLYLSSWPLAIACTAPLSGRLSDRYAPSLLATCGLALLAAGLSSLALLHAGASTFDLLWRNIMCGIGFGLFQAPNNRELLGKVPREQAGIASGMLATMRVLGQTLGAAGTAIILGALPQGAHASALEAALRMSLGIAAAIAAGAALFGALRLRYIDGGRTAEI